MMDSDSRLLRCIAWTCLVALLIGCARSTVAEDDQGPGVERPSEMQIELGEAAVSSTPDWFVRRAVYSDIDGMLFVATRSACMNPIQAEEELERECVRSVNSILDQWFGSAAGEKMNVSGDYILEHLVFQQRKEIRIDDDPELLYLSSDHNRSEGWKYYCGFAQLHLNGKFREFATDRWNDVQTRERLTVCGLTSFSILGLLAVLFAYLKMEAATRGFHSRRLQTLFLLGVVLIVTAAFWFSHILLRP